MIRYPISGLTPHGEYHLMRGQIPMMWLESHDGTVVIDLLGGRTIPDRRAPESVQLAREGLKGLIPPWRSIDQKGASQDGVTFVDSLYDPAEVALTVYCNGRDRTHLRKVVRDLIASIDTKKTSKLHFFSQDAGHWWADLRWFKTPPDPNAVAAQRRHRMTLITRADDAFWRTDPSVDVWQPSYEAMSEKFNFTSSPFPVTPVNVAQVKTGTMGTNWPVRMWGYGQGGPVADGSKCYWSDQTGWHADDRTAMIGPYKDFTTDTDYQVGIIRTDSPPQAALLESGANDIWLRVGRNSNGTWNGYGVRARIRRAHVEFAYSTGLDGGGEPIITTMRVKPMLRPPHHRGDEWMFVAGVEGNPRQFVLYRNGMEILNYVETGTGSPVGSAYRGVGFGMYAARQRIGQAAPSSVRSFTAADNITVAQEGYLTRYNPGDQDYYDNYTVFGPGTFKFWLGPGAGPNDYVEFGPLLPSQVVQINTDPRSRSVQDLTSQPASPEELKLWENTLSDVLDIAGNYSENLANQVRSVWGVLPPQGPLYALLKGRWTDAAGIPAKKAGESMKPHKVKVAVDNGSANSRIIASGTPLRRYPL